MKVRVLLLILLFISLFLELIIFSFPLVFLFCYIIFSIEDNFWYLIPAAFLSFLGDAILGNPIGATLIAVTLTHLSIYLYSRFLGSKDVLVYVLIGMISISVYAIIFGYSITSLFNWFILALAVYAVYKLVPKKYLSL